ncbi:1573_t:CDS:2, partial [Cetraspora pellucida]
GSTFVQGAQHSTKMFKIRPRFPTFIQAFEEASRLCVGMQFESWDYVNLVLLAYGQQKG